MGGDRKQKKESLVLVGVINRRKDMEILLEKRWYRIPVRYAPRQKPAYLAFYQTRVFGKEGGAIWYYARVKSSYVVRRLRLLPDEKKHPRARDYYYRLNLDKVRRTPRIIRNDSRRRISFGFTTMVKLKSSERICQLFDIVPLEDMMRQALQERGLRAVHEHCLMAGGRCRYRLDFAIFCRRGKIALECDNEKWHSTRERRMRDKTRDRYLKKHGWTVLRLRGGEIQEKMDACLKRIEKAVSKLGGQ